MLPQSNPRRLAPKIDSLLLSCRHNFVLWLCGVEDEPTLMNLFGNRDFRSQPVDILMVGFRNHEWPGHSRFWGFPSYRPLEIQV